MEDKNRCLACGNKSITITNKDYHFTESGLDNLYLKDIETLTCNICGEEVVSIPKPTELMSLIGEYIVLKKNSLSGEEIKLLRKNLHLKINEFAQLIGVDRVTVSRWENGHETPPKTTDRLIRLIYVTKNRLDQLDNSASTLENHLLSHMKQEREGTSEENYYIQPGAINRHKTFEIVH